MPIDATNSLVNAGRSLSVRQNLTGRTSSQSSDQPAVSQTTPEDVAQICKPATASLDAATVQRMADYAAYEALTQSSLSAISQIQQGNEQLMKLLGG